MGQTLRVVIADDDQDTLEMYQALLSSLGHTVVACTTDGKELIRLCEELVPDLAIVDVRLPSASGIEAAAAINKVAAIPIILISGSYEESYLNQPGLMNVMACLMKPVKFECLRASIPIAVKRFKEFHAMVEELAAAHQALHDRTIIDRAKAIIMERAGISEGDAFRRLHKLAWDSNTKLAKVAEMILLADSATMPFEPQPKASVRARRPQQPKAHSGQH